MCLAGALSALERKPTGDRLRRYLDLQFVEGLPGCAAGLNVDAGERDGAGFRGRGL